MFYFAAFHVHFDKLKLRIYSITVEWIIQDRYSHIPVRYSPERTYFCLQNEGFVPAYLGSILAGNFPCASRAISLRMHDLAFDENFHKLVKTAILNSRE